MKDAEMNKMLGRTLAFSSSFAMLTAAPVLAQDGTSQFEWEGEIEIGNESVFHSDVAGNEISNTYATISLGATYRFGPGIAAFGTLTAESLTDPVSDRAFKDMGIYVEELGLQFAVGDQVTVSLGKLHPVFGSAWDDTAGFFGGSLAEDYELVEQIGILADVEVMAGGVLSMGAFFADTTVLSESVGFDRGRNQESAGGAGNTGTLDNVAIQWRQEIGDTFYQIGARHLSKGTGDVSDENGILLGLGHNFGDTVGVFAELARFNNFGGGVDDATYATLNGAYYMGPWSFSGTLATRDLDSAGRTDLASVGAEYELGNGMTLGGALAYVDEAGTKNNIIGVNLVIPLGG